MRTTSLKLQSTVRDEASTERARWEIRRSWNSWRRVATSTSRKSQMHFPSQTERIRLSRRSLFNFPSQPFSFEGKRSTQCRTYRLLSYFMETRSSSRNPILKQEDWTWVRSASTVPLLLLKVHLALRISAETLLKRHWKMLRILQWNQKSTSQSTDRSSKQL